MGKRLIIILLLILTGCGNIARKSSSNDSSEKRMKHTMSTTQTYTKENKNELLGTMTINGQEYDFVLNDSEAAKNFSKRMPFTISLEDYSNTEKIHYFDKPLELGSTERGHSPEAGDITIFEPWGNLAIFYKDFSYSNRLIHLGTFIDGSNQFIELKTDFEATFEMKE